VFDLSSVQEVAWARAPSPASLGSTLHYALLSGPDGKRYPFIAPASQYLGTKGYWDYLCLFDPARLASPDPACGAGFKSASLALPANALPPLWYRHAGGWVEDIDADGWEDIHLPFATGYILSISGRTAQRIATTQFDVASQTEPNSLQY